MDTQHHPPLRGKPPTHSRTLWFAALVAVLAGLNAATGLVSDPVALSWIGIGVAALTAFLRAITSDRIEL